MITWGELICRFLGFMVEKVTGKEIELTMDNRRKAAKQFLNLYHTVTELEVLSKELVIEVRYMSREDEATTVTEWLRNISYAVDETSQRFLESTQGLRTVLQIYDPALAETVSDLEANKFSFLLEAANGFKVLNEKESREIEYTYPTKDVSRDSLLRSYQWYLSHPLDGVGQTEWPEDVLLNFVVLDDVKSERVKLDDPDAMLRFATLLEHHVQSLTVARESLAELIRQRFSLEDLLALKAPVRNFDRIHAMHRMSDAVSVPYLRFFAGQPVRKFPPPSKPDKEKLKNE